MPILHQPVPHARDCLDGESVGREVLSEMPQDENAPIERIVGDDPALPAELSQHLA